MKMTIKGIEPYRRKDGTWDVRKCEKEIEIKDEYLNRHSLLCARCEWPDYPACREWCDNGPDEDQW